MIYFRTKPDSVFLLFVDCALHKELKEIQRISSTNDTETWQLGYAELGMVFSPYSAVITLEDLIKANRASQVYKLTDYHWLLLYDSLKNYCVWHNETLAETAILFRVLEGIRFGPIDWESMMDRYFWDQEFFGLLYHSRTGSSILEVCECSSESEFDLTYGLSPHPFRLKLEVVQEKAWHIPEPQECGQWRLP